MSIRNQYFQGILNHNYSSFRNVYGQIEYKLTHKIQLPTNFAPFCLMAWYSSSGYFLNELKEQMSNQNAWIYVNRQSEEYALLGFLNYLPEDYFADLWSIMVSDYAKIVTKLYDVSIETNHILRCQSQLYRSFLEWSKSSFADLQSANILPPIELNIPQNLEHNYRKHLFKHNEEFVYSSFYPISHWWWHIDG